MTSRVTHAPAATTTIDAQASTDDFSKQLANDPELAADLLAMEVQLSTLQLEKSHSNIESEEKEDRAVADTGGETFAPEDKRGQT